MNPLLQSPNFTSLNFNIDFAGRRRFRFGVIVEKKVVLVMTGLGIGLQLETRLNSTCLPSTPTVVTVQRGTSSSIFLSDDAYKSFMFDKFNVSTFDMESAGVALICLHQRVPFIAFHAISGGSDKSKSATFFSLASKNSVTVVVEFIMQLSNNKQKHHTNLASGTSFAPEV